MVVLDEFNIVNDKTGMAALIKELHFVTFVLVGTAVDVRMLLKDHASVARQLEEGQIRIKEMESGDLEEIVRREEVRSRKAFRFETAVVQEIVKTASGLPYFVHLLGRYALTEAISSRSSDAAEGSILVVQRQHLEQALARSAEGGS